MEETVGRWWHEAVTRWVRPEHAAHAVRLDEVRATLSVLFRAGGGAHSVRLSEASAQRVGGPRHWLQRVAGSNERATLPTREPDVLALPPSLAVFGDRALNRDLYLWLALMSAEFQPTGDWLGDNAQATARTLARFPGFASRQATLRDAHLRQRPDPKALSGAAAAAERAVQAVLAQQGGDRIAVQPSDVAPVWLWVMAGATFTPEQPAREDGRSGTDDSARQPDATDGQRRRARAQNQASNRPAMVLPFRSEALMTWSESVQVDRGTDDSDQGDARRAADDMDRLSIGADGRRLAARVKFDLDLPSASADDLPLGPGQPFPEWDYRKGLLVPDHCRVQERVARPGAAFVPTPALHRTARQLRRRLDVLRDLPAKQRGQDSGDDIDLDAWVRLRAEDLGDAAPRSDAPPVYTRRVRAERSLATLLLADLSQSTDAHASNALRVIDVIRDALYVFGEALSSAGDPFAIWGFSSVRRHNVRMQHIKSFEQPWSEGVRSRIGAIRPGYYTRIGAALRHATAQLQPRGERRRLLMLLTDGKPNDLDVYEGRYGLEDTRHAIHQARQAGLTPFCVTIDPSAHEYLPMLFGRQGYALVHRPQDLVRKLTQSWSLLTR